VRQVEPSDRDEIAALFAHAVSECEITYLTHVDHVSHEALVAIDSDGAILGIAQYDALNGRPHYADVGVLVAGDWRRRGVGAALLRLLTIRARSNHLVRLTATTTWGNSAARALYAAAGFRASGSEHGGRLELSLDLRS
jgi:L-amino acid N-acyltransferase YncA